jgi:hypothetical protein
MNDTELTIMCLALLTLFVLCGLDRPNQWSIIRLLLDWALLVVIAFFAIDLIYLR